MNLPPLLAIAFVAAAVATITGFGAAMILTPFMALSIDLKSAIVLVAVFHMFSVLVRTVLLRKEVNLHLVLVYGVPSVLAAMVASWIFGYMNVTPLAWGLAFFIILFSLISLLKPNLRIPQKDSFLAMGGLIGGTVSGLIGMAGGIRTAFLISAPLNKESYIATTSAIAFMTNVSRLVVYLYGGSLNRTHLPLIPPFLIAGLLGVFLGRWFLGRLREGIVRKTVLIALLLIGLKMIYDLIY
jgi:uncharacterized membrane protein YfcA